MKRRLKIFIIKPFSYYFYLRFKLKEIHSLLHSIFVSFPNRAYSRELKSSYCAQKPKKKYLKHINVTLIVEFYSTIKMAIE